MKSISPIMMTVVASLGILSTGCLGVTDDVGDVNALHIDSQVKSALDGPLGAGGTNGLAAEIYRDYKADLDALMQMAITSSGGHVMRTEFVTFGTDTNARALLRYAIECALDDTDYVIANFAGGAPTLGEAFYGEGILTSTQGWRTSGLTLSQRTDVHTCIITRLNPSLVEVPIFWSGANVTPEIEALPDYPVEEALWVAYQEIVDGPFVAHVWPSQYVTEQCMWELTEAAATRVCGTDEGECDIAVHIGEHERKNACEESQVGSGIWTCNGHNAIATRLAESDFVHVFPDCF